MSKNIRKAGQHHLSVYGGNEYVSHISWPWIA